MFKRITAMLQPGLWGLLLAGCTAKTEPANVDGAGAAVPAGAQKVTLHVPGMIERQAIT